MDKFDTELIHDPVAENSGVGSVNPIYEKPIIIDSGIRSTVSSSGACGTEELELLRTRDELREAGRRLALQAAQTDKAQGDNLLLQERVRNFKK